MALQKDPDRPDNRDTAPSANARAHSILTHRRLNDADALLRFVTEYGKIVPARLTLTAPAASDQEGRRRARNTWACSPSPERPDLLCPTEFLLCRMSRALSRLAT
jgi:ribosomal protein S18